MNQILYTGNKKSSKPASLKSILRFFGIAILIFGAIFIGIGSFTLYKNHISTSSSKPANAPEVAFSQEGNNAIINITHSKGISKVKYNWEGKKEEIKQGNMQKSIIIDNISIPTGKNTLYVTVVDENDITSQNSYEFAYDGISIEYSVIDNTYIKITATDVKGLSYISYKWNSGEELVVYPTTDNTIIEQQVEIPSGLNTLSTLAVNSENKTLTKSLQVKGNRPPDIRLYLQGNDLIVSVSDEEGIAEIVQKIEIVQNGSVVNEKTETIPTNGVTQFNYKYEVSDNENIIVRITATDTEGVQGTFNGKNY